MSTKDIQTKLVETMEHWQKIEDASVASTGAIIDKTKHPLIRLVMEIIQADSQQHHRVQQFIADITGKQPLPLSIEDLSGVWDGIEKHIAIEKKMVAYVEETLESIKGRKMLLQEYLLRYLRELTPLSTEDLLEGRYQKFRNMGVFETAEPLNAQ